MPGKDDAASAFPKVAGLGSCAIITEGDQLGERALPSHRRALVES